MSELEKDIERTRIEKKRITVDSEQAMRTVFDSLYFEREGIISSNEFER